MGTQNHRYVYAFLQLLMRIDLSEKGRDPVLDFWRGIAVTGVLLQHFTHDRFYTLRAFRAAATTSQSLLHSALVSIDNAFLSFCLSAGTWGVEVFFVISGYLITTLMLEEERKTGSMSVKRFYFRRIFRIFPAYFFYLLCLVVFFKIGWITFDVSQIPYASGFLCNTSLAVCGWNIAHTWTLAVEEQFYLLWPLLFVTIPKRFRTGFVMAVIAIFLVMSCTGILTANGFTNNALAFMSIALGALYALYRPFRVFIWNWGIAVSIGILAVLGLFDIIGPVRSLSHIAYEQLTPLVLLSCVVFSYRFTRFKNTRVFALIAKFGLISYGVYLWQQVFTNDVTGYPAGSPFLFSLLLIVPVLFSYFVIEKPAIAWAKRYWEKKSGPAPVKDVVMDLQVHSK